LPARTTRWALMLIEETLQLQPFVQVEQRLCFVGDDILVAPCDSDPMLPLALGARGLAKWNYLDRDFLSSALAPAGNGEAVFASAEHLLGFQIDDAVKLAAGGFRRHCRPKLKAVLRQLVGAALRQSSLALSRPRFGEFAM